jgi:hypothetical protein
MSKQQAVSLLLRLGLAFAFFYGAAASILRPDDWASYFPSILKTYLSNMFLLRSFEAIEILLGIWLISGKRVFVPSVISVAILLLAALVNIGTTDMAFLGISLTTAALSLSIIHSPRSHATKRSS